MPRGHTIVSWTPDNDTKLFHTILAVHDIQVNYAAVAAAFGPGVPATCIRTRMQKLRKTAKESGLLNGTSPSTTRKRASTTAMSATPKRTKTTSKVKNEVDSGNEVDDSDSPPETSAKACAAVDTTPTPTKDRTPRVSPRKNGKLDYKKLTDPFNSMTDVRTSDGEEVFEKEGTDSEDSAATDNGFEGGEAEEGTEAQTSA